MIRENVTLWHETPDVACLEGPAGVLFHFAWKRGKVLGVDVAAPHRYHAIHPAVSIKDGASAAAVGDVVDGGNAQITSLVGLFNDESLSGYPL